MHILPDGIYDVMVVEVESNDGGDVHIEVVITLGPLVGDVVALRGRHVDARTGSSAAADPITLLGTPGTMRVRNGEPSFRPEQS